MSSTDDAPAAPLTELPAHVTLQILARLSARDLEKFKLGKLKQVCKYLFAANPGLTPHLAAVLSADENAVTAEATLERIERLVEAHWRAPTDVLVDAFSMRAGYERGMRDGGKAAQSR